MLMERSGNALMKIKYWSEDEEDVPSVEYLGELHLISQHSDRLACLELATTRSTLVSNHFPRLSERLPHLKVLKLTAIWGGSPPLHIQHFSVAPKLDSLSLENFDSADTLVLPWPQIRILKLEDFPEFTALSTISLCINAESVEVIMKDAEWLGDMDAKVISCPAKLFSIRATCIDLLDYIAMPALSCLKICRPDDRFMTWYNSLELENTLPGFLRRSSCSISTFEVSGSLFKPEDWLEMLFLMPTLTSLTLDESVMAKDTEYAISDEFFQQLRRAHLSVSAHSPADFLLPRLENLSIKTSGTTFTDSAFKDMVKSRCLHIDTDVIARLRSVELHTRRRSLAKDCVEELRSISRGGVRIRLCDKTGRLL
jgi:hypothetical protein